jgi:hypothetical protein
MALGPTHPTIQWVLGALSLGVKQPGHEVDHSPPSSAEVKNAWSYTSTPPICFHGVVLNKHRDSFTFTFYHPAQLLHQFFAKHSTPQVRQIPCKFYPFPTLKNNLKGKRFGNVKTTYYNAMEQLLVTTKI